METNVPSIGAVIEEVLPSENYGRIMLRVQQFLRAGVPMVCLLHPEEPAISVYRAGRGLEFYEEWEEFTGDDVLPNFRCKVAEFFACGDNLPKSGNGAMSEPDHIQAYKHATRQRAEILASKVCGCFYCLGMFSPDEIDWWLNDGTAMCPKCGIDSVIGSASGLPITSEFLTKMKVHWFDN